MKLEKIENNRILKLQLLKYFFFIYETLKIFYCKKKKTQIENKQH